MAATLYLVATPIGNLEDITFRAVRILREVSRIACEDTRQTRKLLEHYGIRTPTLSYHEHNERARAGELMDELAGGLSIALVSDSGMPLISDPGYRLVEAAIQRGFRVEPVPGPTAALTALAASGLPADAFYFGGFLPAKATRRRKLFETLAAQSATLVFYEAPHRILETLADLCLVLGARPVVVAREMTKVHEEFLRGPADEVLRVLSQRTSIKGEITLLIRGEAAIAVDEPPVPVAVASLMEDGWSRMDAIKETARRRAVGKREVYRLLEEGK